MPPFSSLYYSYISPRPPISTLFPYTTLFRSGLERSLSPRHQPQQPSEEADRAARSRRDRPQRKTHAAGSRRRAVRQDRKSTRLNSSHRCISYAVFCLKKKKNKQRKTRQSQIV